MVDILPTSTGYIAGFLPWWHRIGLAGVDAGEAGTVEAVAAGEEGAIFLCGAPGILHV